MLASHVLIITTNRERPPRFYIPHLYKERQTHSTHKKTKASGGRSSHQKGSEKCCLNPDQLALKPEL